MKDGEQKIAIILLNWNGADDTIDCLSSITDQTGLAAFHTIIVDNNSNDGSSAQIARYCDAARVALERVRYDAATGSFSPAQDAGGRGSAAVTLIEADDNLGFCIGNNVGAAYAFRAGADAALILNNDTTVAPDMVQKLAIAASKLGPRTLISPQILYHDQPETIWWCGGEFSRTLSPSYSHQGEARRQGDADYSKTEWVSGCATLISSELFDEIALYDPLFFIWCEEWDLSLRATAKGIAMRVASEAIVYHKVGKSLGVVSPLTYYYAMRNMIFLRRRYLAQPLRALFWLAYGPRKLTQAIKLAFSKRNPIYIRAFFDALADHGGGIWKRQ